MGYSLNRKFVNSIPITQDEMRKLVMHNSEKVYNVNRKITDVIQNNSQFINKRCFVIGGGESLIGFDFSCLDGEISIGCNISFKRYNSTFIYMMDIPFHNNLIAGEIDKHYGEPIKQMWDNYQGYKVLLCPQSPFRLDKSVCVIKRIENKIISVDINDGIYGGSNSGMGALMLAIALGCNPIYLLGYDLRVEKQTHWHKGYPKQTYQNQRRQCENFRDEFIEFAPMIENLGVKVYNCFEHSAISCFEYKNIDEVLSCKM